MAQDKIILWGHNSSRAMRVRWTLEEFGLRYDVNPIGSRTGETQTEDYGKLNPKRKIPTLQHRDFVLTESPAIIAYLAESFDPPAGFHAPRNALGRAKVNEWCTFVAMELDAHSLYIVRRHEGLAEIYGAAPEVVQSAKEYYLRQLNAVADRVDEAGTYLFGESFSIADIMLMTCLDWGRSVGVALPQQLSDYQSRVGERPAYHRAFAMNYSDRTIADMR